MSLFRFALSVVAAMVVVLLGATPAFAHTTLQSSDPAEGASLSTAPDQVTLTFAEAVTLPQDPISVTGPDGASWIVGTSSVAGPVVTAKVGPTGPVGQYTLRYTVIADDGDQVKGTVRFTLTTAETPTKAPDPVVAQDPPTTAAAPAASSSGSSVWAWVAVAVVVLGVLAGLGVVRSRRGDRTS